MIKTIFESLDFNIKLWSSFIDFASFILFCFLSPVMIWFDLIDQSTVWYDLIWYDRPVYSMVWFNFVNSISLSLFLFISEERLSSLAETWFIYLFVYFFIIPKAMKRSSVREASTYLAVSGSEFHWPEQCIQKLVSVFDRESIWGTEWDGWDRIG